MQIQALELEGLLLLTPVIHGDSRGYFTEMYHEERYRAAGLPRFVQDNESRSPRGVLRGLHYQAPPYAQAKLIRVIEGEIQDVVVDVRRSSPTFGRSLSVVLNSEEKNQLFVPAGFAHGFAVLSEDALVSYKCDAYYHPQSEGGLRYDDPTLGIEWMLPTGEALVSGKDAKLPHWQDLNSPF